MTKENDKIRALSHREQAREKLPVFYGSRDNFTHGFREILNNGIDEVLNNFDSGIVEVILHDDLETITIKDSGRGIPIQEIDDSGKPYYELIFTTLFASGKYDKNDNTNAGVNGVGTCILNFTSETFKVEVCNQGYKYIIEYEDGGCIKTPLTKLEKTDKHYTKITFKLDKDIYTEIKYTYEYIRNIVDKTAKVSPNITLKLIYKEKEELFHYDSILDYLANHSSNNFTEPFLGTRKVYEESDGEKTQIQITFSSTNKEDGMIKECMLNGNNLIERNSIYEGVLNGFKNFCHKYCKDNGLYIKKEKNISTEDIDCSINFCCNVLSNRVEFQSQTKFSTAKKLYKDVTQKYIQEVLEIYLSEKKDDFIKLVNTVLIAKRSSEKAEASRANIKKKLESEISIINKIPNLIPCKSKDVTKNILCLSEGKSSTSGLMDGRRDIHALYPLRGKVLNCLKASYEQIFCNEVILGAMRALGCGIEIKSKHNKELNTFDINKLKYSKVFIIVDADIDGIGSILPLLITMFYVLTPTLIKEGRIYLCETPKYEILCEDKYYYAINDAELESAKKELQNKKYKVFYVKGLAELNSETMAMCLSEGYQNITQITMERAEESIKSLELFMGDLVKPRQEYILENF